MLTYTFELTAQELDLIGAGLQHLPHKDMIVLFNKLQRDYERQVMPVEEYKQDIVPENETSTSPRRNSMSKKKPNKGGKGCK